MSDVDKYLTEPQAAKLADVVHETINNWGESGKIEVVVDPDVLLRFNQSKPGRPSSRLYLREDIERMRDERRVEPTPDNLDDWWSVREIANEVDKSVRSVYHAVRTTDARTWKAPSGRMFVAPSDAENVMDRLDPPTVSEA